MAEPYIEHEIPSKQLHYSGSEEELRLNLLPREIGFCVERKRCFIKGADSELIPLGLGPEEDYLLTVAHDNSMTGDGTAADPLKVDLSSDGLNISATADSVTVGNTTFERTPEMTTGEVEELLAELN